MSTTTKPAHTPGPWAVPGDGHETMRDDGKTPWRRLSIWAGNQETGEGLNNLASVNIPKGGKWSDPEARANAALISAAPDLLEAARRALEMFGDIKVPSIRTRAGFSAEVTRAALAAAIRKAAP